MKQITRKFNLLHIKLFGTSHQNNMILNKNCLKNKHGVKTKKQNNLTYSEFIEFKTNYETYLYVLSQVVKNI